MLFTTDDVLPKASIDSRNDGTNEEYEGEDSTEEIFDVEAEDRYQSKKSRNEEKTQEESSESQDVSQPRILQKSMVCTCCIILLKIIYLHITVYNL